MYKLIIVWSTGEKSIEHFKDYSEADQAEKNMKMAFGNQIEWSCVDKEA